VVIVLLVVMIIAGMTIPKVVSIAQEIRTGGDARDLNGAILVAKMRASSNYAQTRLHANLNTNTFWVEMEPSGSTTWTTEGGVQYLSKNVRFGYGSLSSPPSGTQTTLGQATTCTGFTNSACIIFNSRGIPVDTTNTPYGNYAIYVTDGRSVTGVTVSVSGVTKVWRSDASSANWIKR